MPACDGLHAAPGCSTACRRPRRSWQSSALGAPARGSSRRPARLARVALTLTPLRAAYRAAPALQAKRARGKVRVQPVLPCVSCARLTLSLRRAEGRSAGERRQGKQRRCVHPLLRALGVMRTLTRALPAEQTLLSARLAAAAVVLRRTRPSWTWSRRHASLLRLCPWLTWRALTRKQAWRLLLLRPRCVRARKQPRVLAAAPPS